MTDVIDLGHHGWRGWPGSSWMTSLTWVIMDDVVDLDQHEWRHWPGSLWMTSLTWVFIDDVNYLGRHGWRRWPGSSWMTPLTWVIMDDGIDLGHHGWHHRPGSSNWRAGYWGANCSVGIHLLHHSTLNLKRMDTAPYDMQAVLIWVQYGKIQYSCAVFSLITNDITAIHCGCN